MNLVDRVCLHLIYLLPVTCKMYSTNIFFRFGDVYPKTLPGRVVGSVCAIVGTLIIALPVPIITENFKMFYQEERNRRLATERKVALEQAYSTGSLPDYEIQQQEQAARLIQKMYDFLNYPLL